MALSVDASFSFSKASLRLSESSHLINTFREIFFLSERNDKDELKETVKQENAKCVKTGGETVEPFFTCKELLRIVGLFSHIESKMWILNLDHTTKNLQQIY